MPIDLAAIKWNRIFRGEVLEWPDLLKKPVWDKKKGKVLTAMKSTGIGAALHECEEAFKAAKMGEYTVGGRNPDEAENFAKANIVPFINGAVMKHLHDQLKALKDLATDTAKSIKKNALIPTASRKLVEEIAEGAEQLMVFCNANSLSGFLEKALQDQINHLNSQQLQRTAMTVQQGKGMGRKAHTAIAGIRESLAAQLDPAKVKTASTDLFDACRDMTQPLINILKSLKAGAQFEHLNEDALVKLSKLLVPYGDGKEASLVGLDRQAIDAKLLNVEKMATAYDLLVDPLKYAG